MNLNSSKLLIRKLFLDGIASIKPDKIIRSTLKVENEKSVVINSKRYDLSKGKCYILGFGKAVLDMALEAESILGRLLVDGVVSLPRGLNTVNKPSSLRLFYGASSNMPDEDSLKATEEIIKLAKHASKDDLVLVMISGGGSALLAKPSSGVTLSEKIDLIKLLVDRGANIKELNCIRKQISDVKGGKLHQNIFPANSVSFVLSDIVGDPLDLIASGPTVKNTNPPSKAIEILQQYNLVDKLSQSLLNNIKTDNRLIDDIVFDKSYNIIVSNNFLALDNLKKKAILEGYDAIILSNEIEGNVELLSTMYAQLSRSIIDRDAKSAIQILNNLNIKKEKIIEIEKLLAIGSNKICLLLGGETVVSIKGKGKGGRNQELALRFSADFNQNFSKKYLENDVVFLSGGTDGIDGPTDAAGAVSYPGQASKAIAQGLDPEKYIRNNDSYNFFVNFDNSDDLIRIGHTGVNVMDLHIILIHAHLKPNQDYL